MRCKPVVLHHFRIQPGLRLYLTRLKEKKDFAAFGAKEEKSQQQSKGREFLCRRTVLIDKRSKITTSFRKFMEGHSLGWESEERGSKKRMGR